MDNETNLIWESYNRDAPHDDIISFIRDNSERRSHGKHKLGEYWISIQPNSNQIRVLLPRGEGKEFYKLSDPATLEFLKGIQVDTDTPVNEDGETFESARSYEEDEIIASELVAYVLSISDLGQFKADEAIKSAFNVLLNGDENIIDITAFRNAQAGR